MNKTGSAQVPLATKAYGGVVLHAPASLKMVAVTAVFLALTSTDLTD